MLAVADTDANSYSTGAWRPPSPAGHLFPSEVNGVFGTNGCCRISDIRDGTSNTLMVGEATGGGPGTHVGYFWSSDNLGSTVDGINGASTAVGGTFAGMYVAGGYASWHPGGCHFALADGSVHFLSQNIDQNLLRALTTRNGPGSGRTWTEMVIGGVP